VTDLEREVRRLTREVEELRARQERQYRQFGDPEGASAPLRARAFRELLKVMRRDRDGWHVYDEDVSRLNTSPIGDYLETLLAEKASSWRGR